MKILIIFLTFMSACSSESDLPATADVGDQVDAQLDVAAEDVGADDTNKEPDVRPEVCSQNSDCWRGEYCSGGRCNEVLGCKPATLPPPDVPEEPRGCWYEHDEVCPSQLTVCGLGTARECETDADCTNPDVPHCVVYVCHHNPSCSAGPCPAGTTCDEELDYCAND